MNFKKMLMLFGLSTLLFGCELEQVTQDLVQEVTTTVTTQVEEGMKDKVNEVLDNANKIATGENKTNVDYSNVNKPSYFMENPEGEVFDAKVVKVTDGDTLKVQFNEKEESIRLLLIDTPETVKQGTEVQLYGPEASEFAKKFFPIGSTVQIDIDQSERDKYGRLLAYVWKDGIMYQDAILNEGLAIVTYIYKPNTSYVDHLRNVEEQAKVANKGVWSVKGYVSNGKYVETPSSSKVVNTTSKEKSTDEEKSNATEKTVKSTNKSSIPDANGDGLCNDVKGNRGSNGWIYHIPGGAAYDKTNPEELFCTTEEAKNAGYRASSR